MHLLIADDHTLFRDAMVEFIRRDAAGARVSVAKSFYEAMALMQDLKAVDLVLLDLRMPGMAGAENTSGIAQMRAAYPNQKIAILSGTAEEDDVTRALAAGAIAYFPKTMSATDLVQAMQKVVAGERFVPLAQPSHYEDPHVAAAPRGDSTGLLAQLTPREREVLAYLGRGAANKDIARDLNLQPATIKLHVAGVCRKLNVKNRTQAALIAQNAGLA